LNRRNNRTRSNRSHVPTAQSNALRGVLSILALLLTFALAFGWGVSQASDSLTSLAGPLAQATVPGEFPTAPQPAPSGVIPVPSGVPSIGPATGENPGSTGSTAASGGFPWLLVVVLLAVAALGVVAVLMMRSRRAPATATGPVMTTPDSARARPTATVATATTTSDTTDLRPDAGATTPIAPPIAAIEAPAPTPTTLTCPNCHTDNDWNENFCHECGQDLRPVRASILASMAPPADVVTDDMPYLETLDRADEQLEYVLSRKRIVIGSAAGCDIMVDRSFAAGGSVAARHAQLLRNDDGSFSVTDLGAPTGTFINDTRVGANTAAALSDGDQIRVGSVRFVYRVP
jgi:hypothetical protein